MQVTRKLGFGGQLEARKIGAVNPAPFVWKAQNALRPGFVKGWIAAKVIVPFANAWGVATMMGELAIRQRKWYDNLEAAHFMSLRRDGLLEEAEAYAKTRTYWIDYGVVSRRVVTNAGVAFLVDDWDGNGQDISTFIYHGCGTDNTAENAADSALGGESTTALDPNSTRATGTQSQPASNQLRSIGVLTFDGIVAVVEHGLFSQAATGGGTLFDRSIFSALNVVSADSIQFTYTLTASAGS